VGLVAGEVDRRTVYVTLAKPVSRAQFIVGRYLGLCANLLLLVVVMGGALCATLFASGYPMGATGLSALALIAVELCVLAAFAVVFSSFTTPTLGVIFSLSFFVIGHLAGDLAVFAARLPAPTGQLVAALARVVPNLDLMNLKTQAANQLPVSAGYVAASAGYGLCYAAAAVGLAAVIFSRRDLK
jgi:ABC-type transport system involved in multi-copper enzyme maturation permease subunit